MAVDFRGRPMFLSKALHAPTRVEAEHVDRTWGA